MSVISWNLAVLSVMPKMLHDISCSASAAPSYSYNNNVNPSLQLHAICILSAFLIDVSAQPDLIFDSFDIQT